jgi:hypothetical protein
MFGHSPHYRRDRHGPDRVTPVKRIDAERVHAEALRLGVIVRRVCNTFYFADGPTKHGAGEALAYLTSITNNATTPQTKEPTT